jgi:hypothetical protein
MERQEETMDTRTCPACGGDPAAGHPQGLCPASLLAQGAAATLHCGACQATVDDEARFCAHCGVPAPVAAPPGPGDPLRTALEGKLQGQYRIVRLLGRGGMGAVYLARDLTLDREVAIKVVKAGPDSGDLVARLRREARLAARLAHPNIVPLHAFGEVGGTPYFVMGYVRGEPLAARLRRDGRLPEEEARRILAQVADALDHAHRQGIVHRDVKPDNVLLEDDGGRPLLTDFGVAKAMGGAETATRAGSVVGTPHYMSPEQASGREDVDARSDLYALGVLGYAMLAGRLPFEGASAADVLAKHLTQEPAPLRSLVPSVSEATAQVVARCLAKDPAHRWPDARSLRRALGAVEESHLPDALQSAEGKGLPSLVFVLLYSLLFSLTRPPTPVMSAFLGVFVVFYVFGSLRLRAQGFSLREAQVTIWREPSWWPFWYPRALRRRGNVWDRLPPAVRHMRGWYFAACGLMFSYWLLILAAFRLQSRPTVRLAMAMGATTVLASGFWPFLRRRALRELSGRGLGHAEVHRVMMTAPLARTAFWARPHIAAMLAPPGREPQDPRPDTPHDHLQSILRDAQELAGPVRPLGAQAAAAARQLLAAIDHAEREMADLARNLEPGEEDRLAVKIAALGADPATRPLRQLLEKQLALVRDLSRRLEAAADQRTRRTEMLKALALHVASLRARTAVPPDDVLSLSERVRTLCDEIGSAEAPGFGGLEDMETRPGPPVA